MQPSDNFGEYLAVMRLTACIGAALLCAPVHAQQSQYAPPDAATVPIAHMVDLSTGQILFSRNGDRRFIPASITKVMTTFVAFEKLAANELSLNARYNVRAETAEEWFGKGSTMFVPKDAEPSVDELLHGITTVSANDASIILAEGAAGSVDRWLGDMNQAAAGLGMRDTRFGTPNGWPDEGGTFTSARDLTKLADALLMRHPKKYAHFFGENVFSYGGYTQRNHDPISGVVRGADGIKTGYTNESGYGFLGTARRNGQRLVMVVAGADSGYARDRASRQFMEWGFTAFDRPVLFQKGETVVAARVQNAGQKRLTLTTRRPIYLNLPKQGPRDVSLKLIYDGPLKAPIARGENIAELAISVGDMPTYRVPLVAAEDLAAAGPITRLANAVSGWVS